MGFGYTLNGRGVEISIKPVFSHLTYLKKLGD